MLSDSMRENCPAPDEAECNCGWRYYATKVGALEEQNARLWEALNDLVDAEDHVPWDDYSEQAHYHNIEAAVIRARQTIEAGERKMEEEKHEMDKQNME